ncbi:MAG: hypothetical protein HGA27_06130 [Peptococcaceae bacterium]|nr:hypothetical protein [Peptococcaceae bacterium]
MSIIEGGYDGPLSGPWNFPKKREIPIEVPVPAGEEEPKEMTELEKDNNIVLPEAERNTPEENIYRLKIENIALESPFSKTIAPRSKNKNHFMQKLLSKEGVYLGIVMEQVLGRRRGPGRR